MKKFTTQYSIIMKFIQFGVWYITIPTGMIDCSLNTLVICSRDGEKDLWMNLFKAPCCDLCINHEASCLCKCVASQLGIQHRALEIMLWAIWLLKYDPWPNFQQQSRSEMPFYFWKQVYNCLLVLISCLQLLNKALSQLAWFFCSHWRVAVNILNHWQENIMFIQSTDMLRILRIL